MTRNDQIYNQAAGYAIEMTQGQTTGKSCVRRGALFSGFMAGAEWADENPQWISVEDELPKKFERVLVYIGIDRLFDIAYLENVINKQTWWMNNRREIFHVTHWMPLPAPPKKGGEK